MDDDLGQERVEIGAGFVAGVAEAVGADAGAVGGFVDGERAAAGAELAVWAEGFHVHAQLDGVAAQGHGGVQAKFGEARARGEEDLGLDEVDAGDFLRDGVLDLEAGIGLDEDEGLGAGTAGGVDQEFEGAEVAVADGAGEADGGFDDGLA